jgi:hypothetical protein
MRQAARVVPACHGWNNFLNFKGKAGIWLLFREDGFKIHRIFGAGPVF